MKKNILFTLLFLFVSFISFSQRLKGIIDLSKVPVPQWHYQEEYTFDFPSDPGAWQKIESGLNAAFVSTDELYLRCEVPENDDKSDKWQIQGWRGQRLNAQLLVWSPDTLEQIRVKLNDLVDGNGNTLRKEHYNLNLVRYVLSNFPYNGIAMNCAGPLDSTWLMPDRFESLDRFDLPGNTVRPVWLSLDIPETAKPGVYRGSIDIMSTTEKKTLQVEIEVQELTLPQPGDWNFRLDLWQNPWVVAEYYNIEPWSEEHMILLKKHMKLYADAGGTFITTYAVHSPWSDNSYMVEGGMIEWIKKSDGTWEFDYSIFDQYVELCMELGIDEAITVYTPVPWGNRFRYLEEKTGNYVYESWPVDSKDFKANWDGFMDDLLAHLTQKGWFEITYLGINENPMDVTLASINAVRQHSNKWKITYAGDWHPELSELLDDYCVVISSEPKPGDIQSRLESGFTTTYYVCCTPAKPNNFVYSPPVEGRYQGWHTIANGYSGFLRWAYDAWPADPLRDARHTLWPAGDCFMVYPGGNSCIRFEKLREGIVDFEKISILRKLAKKSDASEVKVLMKELEDHLDSFRLDQDYSKRNYNKEGMKSLIIQGEILISNLSDALSK